MAQPNQQLWLPAQDTLGAYDIWKHSSESGFERIASGVLDLHPPNGASLTIGVPVRELISVPLTVPSEDEEIIGGIVENELESLGVLETIVGNDEYHGAWTTLESAPPEQSAVWAVGLHNEIDAPNCKAVSYVPVTSCLDLPKNGIAIWEEHNRPVAVWLTNGNPLHLSPITSQVLTADSADEIHIITKSLSQIFPLEEPISVFLLGISEETIKEDFPPQIATHFQNPPRILPAPVPRIPLSSSPNFRPTSLVEQERSRALQRLVVLGLGSFILMLSASLIAVAALTWKGKKHLTAQAEQLDSLSEELHSTRFNQQQWLSMEGALDPNSYPVEILYQIFKQMPPTGLRITSLETGRGKISIVGVASTQQKATAFKERLLKPEGIGAEYKWNIPQPDIQRDGQANFTATAVSIYLNDE